jgi:hypothetical protein
MYCRGYENEVVMKATLPELKLERYLATKELAIKEGRGASPQELLLLRVRLHKMWSEIAALEAGAK